MRRRTMLAGAGAGLAAACTQTLAVGATPKHFPHEFLWGAATAGHQVEGNNVASDFWAMEHVQPTLFREPSGDADNSFELWPVDLDLVRGLGLNTYRFSLEWARIEPEQGHFSLAMLDHYKAMIEGCRARGLTPVVTFNHFTTPRWFAARGGWLAPDSADLFARYCDRAARHLAAHIGYATTLNEPNVSSEPLPAAIVQRFAAMDAAFHQAVGSDAYHSLPTLSAADQATHQSHLLQGHRKGRMAIKAVRPDLPVGVNLALTDDEAQGPNSLRDAKRAQYYAAWFEAVRADDFLAIQNYNRTIWGDHGRLPPPAGATIASTGDEIYPPSLANAVRYAYQSAGIPILVTEHGLRTDNDAERANFIPAALSELQKVCAEGVPVKGYIHWTLLDNFEWVFGYAYHYGLCSVDRDTFRRTPKPSAYVLGAIARRNAI
ncbi:MAG: family 1 glycosylhydrolase [Terricaulis sp.]